MDYLHYGVPTHQKIENLNYNYVAPLKLWTTAPNDHPMKLQWVWAEADSPLPRSVQSVPHVSYRVPNLETAIEEYDTLEYGPVALNDTLQIAFCFKDGVLFELMQID